MNWIIPGIHFPINVLWPFDILLLHEKAIKIFMSFFSVSFLSTNIYPFFMYMFWANKRDYVLLNKRYTELTCFANNKHVFEIYCFILYDLKWNKIKLSFSYWLFFLFLCRNFHLPTVIVSFIDILIIKKN